MLYRVLIGLIPTVVIALFMTGAIPLGNVLPTTEYRSSAVRAAEAKDGAAKRDAPSTPEGKLSRAVGLLSSDEIDMMEDNMRAVGEMHRAAEEYEKERGLEARSPGWKAKSGGWGRQN